MPSSRVPGLGAKGLSPQHPAKAPDASRKTGQYWMPKRRWVSISRASRAAASSGEKAPLRVDVAGDGGVAPQRDRERQVLGGPGAEPQAGRAQDAGRHGRAFFGSRPPGFLRQWPNSSAKQTFSRSMVRSWK